MAKDDYCKLCEGEIKITDTDDLEQEEGMNSNPVYCCTAMYGECEICGSKYEGYSYKGEDFDWELEEQTNLGVLLNAINELKGEIEIFKNEFRKTIKNENM